MTCVECEDTGFVAFVPSTVTKPDAEIGTDDLAFGVCLCAAGEGLRRSENQGRKVAPLWRVWCFRHQVHPKRICMVEDVFTAEQLTAAGLTKPAQSVSRESALLAAGKGKHR